MYSKKRTDIITFLLTWLLTYGLVKGEASEPTVTAVPPKPASPRPTPRIVADPCSLVYQFAKDEAAFSTCAIVSGNNMCKTCVTQILMLTKSFTKLMGEDSFKRMNDSKCLEGIVTDTTRERYGAYYTSARTMWFTNNCDNCFVESSQQMRDDVKTFYGGASDFDTCLQNNPNNTCDRCKDEYSGLNFWYEKLEDDYRGNVCLDVTAAMVDFRDKWFGLGCISPLAYDVIVIAIGCGVIIACLLMYIISRRFARMHRPGFLTQKRLSMYTEPKPINSAADERTHLLSGPIIS